MKIFYIILILIFCQSAAGQNETANWLFGDRNWLSFYPSIITKDSCNSYFEEPQSSISDKKGNLLFYSDGQSVFNKNHKIIKNGDSLLGDWSASQGCVFVKQPGNDSIFYIFTTDYGLGSHGLMYNIINLKTNTDLSYVSHKNKQIASKTCESISVTSHQNGIYKWIVILSGISNKISAFLLTDKGLNLCPVESSIGYAFNGKVLTYQTKAKFNNGGTMWVVDNMVDGVIKVSSFNNETGMFWKSFTVNEYFDIITGMQFSKNSKYLYIIERELQIVQLNTSTWKKTKIFDIAPTNARMLGAQFGIDGKIYITSVDSSFLSTIENPDENGLNCNFKKKSIFLKHKCTSGLPNFDQSYFYTPAIDFKYELECINNTIQFWGYDTFNARVHQWEFRKLKGGNWQSIGQDKNLNYTFKDTGIYEVRYVAAINSRQDTVSKTIHIYQKINKHFLGKDTVYAKGTPFKKELIAPYGMHCQLWQDSSSLSTYQADTAGRYTCKVTNQSFCEVTDTIEIKECINSLTVPSIYRIKDSLYTYQQVADSFIWFKNNVPFKITKAPVIRLTDTGTYRVEAAKKAHCNRSSANFRIEKLSLHKLNSQAIGIKIYPNPANEKVFIEASTDFSLLVTDATGKTILEAENIKEITLANGIYYFRLTVHNTSYFEKVVVLN